jgi:Holliday junction DNA helicase RuvA
MISYITGKIRTLTREPGRAVVIAGGVGYEVSLPTYVYQSLADEGISVGSDIELEIYYHVTDRQPKPMLVGFRHPSEKQFFEQLIQVEGIGPAKAASALVFPVSTIASAIETEDLASLQRLPGIGTRAAQKIVATLRGKVAAIALLQDAGITEQGQETAVVHASDARSEAIEALVTLGYRPTEAQDKVDDVIRRSPETADDVQDLMREVFKAQISTKN